MPTLGIIGLGTVGTALAAAFRHRTTILTRDPRLGSDSISMEQIARDCAVVFVAVPTPMAPDGNADVTAFQDVLQEFAIACRALERPPVLCVKSAVPPDIIRDALTTYPQVRLVVSPEFLRERSPIDDMLSMRALVLGGDRSDCAVVERLFRHHSNVTGPMRTHPGLDAVGASLLKYQENCFLALKVSFMNEFFELFQASGSRASWTDIQRSFHLDHERMGTTHWHVPGPDGRRGWGGRCLPKDVSALRAFGDRVGVDTPLMERLQERNRLDRFSCPVHGGQNRIIAQDADAARSQASPSVLPLPDGASVAMDH